MYDDCLCCRLNDHVTESLLLLFAYLNTGDMISFAMELNNHNPKFFNKFFNDIEKIEDEEKKFLADFLTEKLLVIYRLNTIPKIFSEDRIIALQIALTKY